MYRGLNDDESQSANSADFVTKTESTDRQGNTVENSLHWVAQNAYSVQLRPACIQGCLKGILPVELQLYQNLFDVDISVNHFVKNNTPVTSVSIQGNKITGEIARSIAANENMKELSLTEGNEFLPEVFTEFPSYQILKN